MSVSASGNGMHYLLPAPTPFPPQVSKKRKHVQEKAVDLGNLLGTLAEHQKNML